MKLIINQTTSANSAIRAHHADVCVIGVLSGAITTSGYEIQSHKSRFT